MDTQMDSTVATNRISTAGLLLLVITGFAACSAYGQSNALWKRSRLARPASNAATAQPADNGTRSELLFAPRIGTGGRVLNSARPGYANETPSPNQSLLATSLMAVEVPPQKKFQVNDQVTVIVREDKRSTTDTTLKNEKKWDISTELEDWIRIDGDEHLVPQNFTRGVPNIGFTYDDKYNGKGKTERKELLTLRVTARIIDVKPNGTLVLEARKTIKSDDDTQLTTLTGTCRSEDVTPDNTVLSTQLADVNISTVSQGPAKDAATSGWLKKALDFLKPF